MAIVFPYPIAVVAYAPLFRCERPIDWLIARVRVIRRTPGRGS